MQAGSRGGRTFIVTCQHGTRTHDRISEVRRYFSRHVQCNAAWEPYTQRPSETDVEHAERLKKTFCFLRHGAVFVGFPEPVPYASPAGETVSALQLLYCVQHFTTCRCT